MSHWKKKMKSGYENLMNKRKREEEQKKTPKIIEYYAKDAPNTNSDMVTIPCSNDTSSEEDTEFAVEIVAFPDKHVVETVSLPNNEYPEESVALQ